MNIYTKNTGLGGVGVFVVVFFLGVAHTGYSQGVNGNSSDGQELVEEREYENNDSQSLRNGITVKKALETVSEKENLILSYDSDLLNSTGEISVTDSHTSLDKTIQEILKDTELEYKIMKTRHLVIYDMGKIGHMKGKVVDSKSWDYLTGTKMYLVKDDSDSRGEEDEDIEQVTYVDTTGRYDFNNVDVGTYKLVVIADGYEQVSVKIEIHNKQTTQKIIELDRNEE